MTYIETLDYLKLLSQKGSVPGLDRIKALLELLGNPQERLKIIHVTGTNGKGSFCAMLSSVMRTGGYNVACFSSPYLINVNEMFTYNGASISDDEFAYFSSVVREYNNEVCATEYEFLTAVAFSYFSSLDADIVIVECCMGGLNDTTNVISSPVMSVITSVDLDHTAFLGSTIPDVAFQKAGIIKTGRPVIAFDCPVQAQDVILKKANDVSSCCYFPSCDVSNIRVTLNGTYFDYSELADVFIPFSACYQVKNAASVIESVRMLKREGFNLSDTSLREGLSSCSWRGRFEILSFDPLVIFDGCHNVHGVNNLVCSINMLFPDTKLVVISGVMGDKSYDVMVRLLSPYALSVYTVTPDNLRALDAKEYASTFCNAGVKATACDDFSSAVAAALDLAVSERVPLLVFGSLYMYKDIKNEIDKLMLNQV